VIESFLNLTVIVVGFYSAATGAVEVARLREKRACQRYESKDR